MQYLDALQAEDLGVVVAGNHFAAVQSMDEESTQTVRYDGGFGTNVKFVRTITPADEDTFTFTALLLKPGQTGGKMANESFMRALKNFRVASTRGDGEHYVYDQCVWTRLHVASTLENVQMTADFSGHLTTFPDSALNDEKLIDIGSAIAAGAAA